MLRQSTCLSTSVDHRLQAVRARHRAERARLPRSPELDLPAFWPSDLSGPV